MPKLRNNMSQVAFTAETIDVQNFKRIFPSCMTHFIRRAIKLALQDRSFFERVFWSEENVV